MCLNNASHLSYRKPMVLVSQWLIEFCHATRYVVDVHCIYILSFVQSSVRCRRIMEWRRFSIYTLSLTFTSLQGASDFPSPASWEANSCNDLKSISLVPQLVFRHVFKDDTFMPYASGNHVPDHIPFYTLEYDYYFLRICALHKEPMVFVIIRLPARPHFLYVCRMQWMAIGGKLLKQEVALLNFSCTRSDN